MHARNDGHKNRVDTDKNNWCFPSEVRDIQRYNMSLSCNSDTLLNNGKSFNGYSFANITHLRCHSGSDYHFLTVAFIQCVRQLDVPEWQSILLFIDQELLERIGGNYRAFLQRPFAEWPTWVMHYRPVKFHKQKQFHYFFFPYDEIFMKYFLAYLWSYSLKSFLVYCFWNWAVIPGLTFCSSILTWMSRSDLACSCEKPIACPNSWTVV